MTTTTADTSDGIVLPVPYAEAVELASSARPRIEHRPDIPGMKAQTLAALTAMGGIYQRSGQIVTVGRVPVVTRRDQQMQLQAVPMNRSTLLDAMARAAYWYRVVPGPRGMAPEERECNPSRDVADALLGQVIDLPLPVLSGVATAPFLRRDGSVCMPPATGAIYDEATALVVDGAGIVFEPPPERPTKEQAKHALEILFEPMSKFDFVGGPKGPHAAAAVASLLTAFARPACMAVPAFVFDAPIKGSGKSKLAALAPLLSTGSDAGVINATARAGEEFEKRLATSLLAARSFILIDNITDSHWDVPLLNSALTEPLLDLRVMGGNSSAQLPNTSQFAITGNNVSAPGDVGRRIIHCRIDPMVDDPAAREFDFEPRAEVLSNRVTLVKAALTILRGYAATAESEAQTATQRRKLIGREMGSFEDWVRVVRDALMWLGMADCVTGAPVGDDEVQGALGTFIKAWQDLGTLLSRNGAQVRDMVRLAQERTAPGERDGGGDPVHLAWREAVLAVAGTGGQVNARRLGKWLAGIADRRVGSACITRVGNSAAGVTWALRLPEETPVPF
jgi:hypothetical protein